MGGQRNAASLLSREGKSRKAAPHPVLPHGSGGGFLLVALFLFGCAPSATRQFPDRELVRFWHPWGGEGEAVVQDIAQRFNASQTRYEVVPLSVPGGDATRTKFMLAVSGGDPPDVVATWETVLPLWARDGIAQPLDPFMSASDLKAYRCQYAVAKKAGSYKGKVYGLCVGLNVPGLYYRPAALRAAGLPDRPPRTLEEMDAWGDRLTQRGKDGSIKTLGLLPGDLRDLAPFFGGGLERGRLDTEENTEALAWLAGRRAKIGFDRYVRFQVGLGLDSAGGSAEAGWPLITGRYSMAVDGQWRVAQVAKFAPEFVPEYRTAPIPPREKGPKSAGYAVATLLVLPTGGKHARGAYEFARFWGGLANPKAAAEMNVAGGWLPSGPEMAAAPAYREYVRRYPQFQAFMDTVARPGLQTHPPVPDQPYLMDAEGKAEWQAISGAKPADVALRDAQRDLDKERARRRSLGERF